MKNKYKKLHNFQWLVLIVYIITKQLNYSKLNYRLLVISYFHSFIDVNKRRWSKQNN